MKKCCYCESSRGYLIIIQNQYWHKECLNFRSRYFDYLQENPNLQIAEKKIAGKQKQEQIDQNIKIFLHKYGLLSQLSNQKSEIRPYLSSIK